MLTWPADSHVSLVKKQCVRRTSISDDNNIIMILHVISIIVCVQTSAHTSRMFIIYIPSSENYRTNYHTRQCYWRSYAQGTTDRLLAADAYELYDLTPMPRNYNLL